MISLNEEKEAQLRVLAKERHGGKKGSISNTVADGITALSQNNKKFRSINHQIALMEKGFDFGLKDRKAFENRSEIYD